VSRFDIGVVIVTFVALALIAVIRGVLVPVVRLRVANYRQASHASDPTNVSELTAEVQRLTQRSLELERQISFAGQPLEPIEQRPTPLKDATQ